MRAFSLERYFARFEFATRYLLGSSDCEALTLAELLELASSADLEAYRNLTLGYTESCGLPELRDLVAQLIGVPFANVVVCAPQEAIYLTMRALLQPGDRVITTFPGYQSLYEIANAIGCRVELWKPQEMENHWRFSPDELERLAEPGVHAIVINFPHNPTGAVLEMPAWKRVQAVAQRSGAYLISDEMYRGLEYSSAPLPPAASVSERFISIGGLSKAYGLPGLRIGWVATTGGALLQKIQQYHDYTTICNSAPSERLAVIALRNAATLQERCRSIVTQNLSIADSYFHKHPESFSWLRPAAGPIAFLRFHREDASAFCEQAALRAGIMLVPSATFEWGDSHIRIGFGRKNFPDALNALDEYLGTQS